MAQSAHHILKSNHLLLEIYKRIFRFNLNKKKIIIYEVLSLAYK